MYIAIDGDSIGKKIEYYILEGKLDELKKFSDNMLKNIENLKRSILKCNGKIYMAGGDNILAFLPDINIKHIIKEVVCLRGINSFSIGYSQEVQGAYLALKYAKVLGNNKIIYAYNNDGWNFKEFVIHN